MNAPALNTNKPLTIILLLLGLMSLSGAAALRFLAPAGPSAIEAGDRPIAFSLGLDSPDVRRADRQSVRAFWRSGACVLPNGFAGGVGNFWPDLERAAPDPTLARVKVIPSGGLYPYYRSSSFAEEIAAFVRDGGSLVCFGQPLGAMYGALPGAPQGVGWAEVAAAAKESVGQVQVGSDHPVLAAMSRPEFEMHFAGFFTKIPGTDMTEVILRDAVTARPVVVAYRHGRGLVVATTLLSDAATLAGRLRNEEQTFLAELLTWARAGGNVWRYAPGDQVAALYKFKPGQTKASEGFVEIYRPDGTLDQSFACALEDDGAPEPSKPFDVTEPRGIWRIVTYGRDSAGQAAGPASSTWLAVGRAPATTVSDGFRGTVCVPGAYLVTGAVLPINVYMWNDASTPTEITYRGPAGKRTVKLAAGQSRILVDEVVLDKPGTRSLDYEFYGSTGEKLGQIKRRVVAGEPDRVFAGVSGPTHAKAGQVAQFTLQVLATNPGGYNADCWLRLVHNGRVLWQEPRRLKLNGAYSARETIKVPVPRGEHGRLVLEATLAWDGKPLAEAWAEMEVE